MQGLEALGTAAGCPDQEVEQVIRLEGKLEAERGKWSWGRGMCWAGQDAWATVLRWVGHAHYGESVKDQVPRTAAGRASQELGEHAAQEHQPWGQATRRGRASASYHDSQALGCAPAGGAGIAQHAQEWCWQVASWSAELVEPGAGRPERECQ